MFDLRLIGLIALAGAGVRAWSEELEATTSRLGSHTPARKVCAVEPDPDGGDDSPAILQAFSDCGRHGLIKFSNATYNIHQVMRTVDLEDVIIDLKGTLLWNADDLPYWLNNSLENGYQNQTSAWHLGGDRLVFLGHGVGTLDGNGQVWYDFVKGKSNYPRRPHALTIWNTTNSLFHGIRFVQSQMWTMTIIHSKKVLLRDIYVNSTSHSSQPARNTDGADTIYSDKIWFDRWTVDNGDDSIAMKANSTNILITDSDFIRGLGVAIGSIGQYEGRFETVENVTARNIRFNHMRHAAYVKTWTGQDVGDPPNGGGGGLGYAKNLVFEDFYLQNNTGVFAIGQCTVFSGAPTPPDCNSSLFNVRDVRIANWTGTVATPNVVLLQCSGASPCANIQVEDVNLTGWNNGTQITGYLCSNVASQSGFECTGKTCERPSSTAECPAS